MTSCLLHGRVDVPPPLASLIGRAFWRSRAADRPLTVRRPPTAPRESLDRGAGRDGLLGALIGHGSSGPGDRLGTTDGLTAAAVTIKRGRTDGRTTRTDHPACRLRYLGLRSTDEQSVGRSVAAARIGHSRINSRLTTGGPGTIARMVYGDGRCAKPTDCRRQRQVLWSRRPTDWPDQTQYRQSHTLPRSFWAAKRVAVIRFPADVRVSLPSKAVSALYHRLLLFLSASRRLVPPFDIYEATVPTVARASTWPSPSSPSLLLLLPLLQFH